MNRNIRNDLRVQLYYSVVITALIQIHKSRIVPSSLSGKTLYLNIGQTLEPVLLFWVAMNVARSARCFKKWKSFSDSMHCFLFKK